MSVRSRNRPRGRSRGADPSDLYRPEVAPSATPVEDERAGLVLCRKCGHQVVHVLVAGAWHVRDPDGLPHRLTCEA